MFDRIKNKTYRNFMFIKNKLMTEKGYPADEASKITHLIFENHEANNKDRSIKWFYDMVISKQENENA